MEIWRLTISAMQRGKLISTGNTSLYSLSSISSSDLALDFGHNVLHPALHVLITFLLEFLIWKRE